MGSEEGRRGARVPEQKDRGGAPSQKCKQKGGDSKLPSPPSLNGECDSVCRELPLSGVWERRTQVGEEKPTDSLLKLQTERAKASCMKKVEDVKEGGHNPSPPPHLDSRLARPGRSEIGAGPGPMAPSVGHGQAGSTGARPIFLVPFFLVPFFRCPPGQGLGPPNRSWSGSQLAKSLPILAQNVPAHPHTIPSLPVLAQPGLPVPLPGLEAQERAIGSSLPVGTPTQGSRQLGHQPRPVGTGAELEAGPRLPGDLLSGDRKVGGRTVPPTGLASRFLSWTQPGSDPFSPAGVLVGSRAGIGRWDQAGTGIHPSGPEDQPGQD